MPGFRRLPNKYGTITKLSGKRRKPYCARKYAGEVWDEDKQRIQYRYISVGTFSTRREALDALAKANADENYAKEAISFGAVADKWLEEKRPEISDGLYRVYRSAMIKFTPIRKRQMRSLKTDDLERLLNSDNVPRTVKGKCKIALNGIYDYAIRHEYVDKDYSALVRVHADQKAQIERVVFTPEEVKELKEKDRSVVEDIALVMLYTGLRISEALNIRMENVDPEAHLLTGVGLKTEAGKNRTVPITHDVYDAIMRYYDENPEKASNPLFTIDGRHVTANQYAGRFRAVFEGHTTHDCRHSFATYAYKCKMDATAVKLIMGHRVNDITQGRYTHVTADDLKKEMEKYEIK